MFYFMIALAILFVLTLPSVTAAIANFFLWFAYDRHWEFRLLYPKWYDGLVYWLGFPVVVAWWIIPIVLFLCYFTGV